MRKQIICALRHPDGGIDGAHGLHRSRADRDRRGAARAASPAKRHRPAAAGIALVPKAANPRVRMVQVVNGAVTVDGDTLDGRAAARQAWRRRRNDRPADVSQRRRTTAARCAPEGATRPPPAAAARTPAPHLDAAHACAGAGDAVALGAPQRRHRADRRRRRERRARTSALTAMCVAIGGSVDDRRRGHRATSSPSVGGLTLGPHAVVRGEVTRGRRSSSSAIHRRRCSERSTKSASARMARRFRLIESITRNILFGSLASRVGTLATTIARVLMFMLFVLIVTAVGQRPVQQIAARIAAEPAARGTRGPARGDPVRAGARR